MKKMKKLIILALVLALVTTAGCLTALADNTASRIYDQMADLLFRTDNVTLKLKAEFSLDGKWFKTADVVLRQDGIRSFRQMLLTSPKKDGTERHNGYTIVTEGSVLHLMEVYYPGVYRDGTCAERDSLLHRSAKTEQLLALGGALASQADLLLGKDAVTEAEDGTFLLNLGKDTPALVNYALSELAQFAVGRYYGINYDDLNAEGYGIAIDEYATVKEAIIWMMRGITVKQAAVTVKTDADGKISAAEGAIDLDVEMKSDGVHALGITFTAEVTDRGSTTVAPFDPKDYDVVLADGAASYQFEEYNPEAEELEEDKAEQYVQLTEKIWKKTGQDLIVVGSMSGYRNDGMLEMVLDDQNLRMRRIRYDENDVPVLLEIEPYVWLGIDSSEYNYEPEIDEETDGKAKELMMNFIREVNPQLLETVKDLKAACTFEVDGALYAQYNEEPLDQNDGGVLFVVRLSPGMWIEYYTTISNG